MLDEMKKRLQKAKGRWTEELHSILWAYRTPGRSTGGPPFPLAYGREAVIRLSIIRTNAFDTGLNDLNSARNLNLHEMALVKLTEFNSSLLGFTTRGTSPGLSYIES